jgi:hypothetical protein
MCAHGGVGGRGLLPEACGRAGSACGTCLLMLAGIRSNSANPLPPTCTHCLAAVQVCACACACTAAACDRHPPPPLRVLRTRWRAAPACAPAPFGRGAAVVWVRPQRHCFDARGRWRPPWDAPALQTTHAHARTAAHCGRAATHVPCLRCGCVAVWLCARAHMDGRHPAPHGCARHSVQLTGDGDNHMVRGGARTHTAPHPRCTTPTAPTSAGGRCVCAVCPTRSRCACAKPPPLPPRPPRPCAAHAAALTTTRAAGARRCARAAAHAPALPGMRPRPCMSPMVPRGWRTTTCACTCALTVSPLS